jgi:RimJ/RimL family protein N-acetyltransferase
MWSSAVTGQTGPVELDVIELRTIRLRLRRWRDEDREPFATLNADATVMEHFPAVLSRAESDALVDRITAGFAERGWGLWAVEIQATGTFAGFVGLNPATFDAPFTPANEIGWRLARAHWNQGVATEAAQAVVDYGFGVLGLDEVVSFTATANLPSQRVMQKLGMHHDPADDFDHPHLPAGHHLRRHVLYRLARPR